MSLLYWGCLREGEIATSVHTDHVLHLEQVFILRHSDKEAPHALQLNFKSFKHSRGRTSSIILKRQPHRLTCPVVTLSWYLSVRPHLGRKQLFITLPGPTVTRSFLVANLLKALSHTKHGSSGFNSHSLRIGHKTDLVLQGKSDAFIQKVGRWSSTTYRKYICPHVITFDTFGWLPNHDSTVGLLSPPLCTLCLSLLGTGTASLVEVLRRLQGQWGW